MFLFRLINGNLFEIQNLQRVIALTTAQKIINLSSKTWLKY